MSLIFTSGTTVFLTTLREIPTALARANYVKNDKIKYADSIRMMHSTIKTMASNVEVNVEDESIMIYSDKNLPLINYSDTQKLNKFSPDFFAKWKIVPSLMFEFQVYNKSKFIFSLFGIWFEGKWDPFEVIPYKVMVMDVDPALGN